MCTMTPWISAEGLSVRYGTENVLSNESFDLQGPGLFLVIGPNGAGKTTLFRALLGLLKVEGRVYMNGIDVTGDPGKAGIFAGYVPQLGVAEIPFPVSVREFIESAFSLRKRILPSLSREEKLIVDSLIKKLGLEGVEAKPFLELSGGMKQRVLLARAIARDPQILIMDEPIASIDPAFRSFVLETIEETSKEKLVLVSSHDPALFLQKAKVVIALNRGIVAMGPPEEVLRIDVMSKVYGRSVVIIDKCLHVVDYHAV